MKAFILFATPIIGIVIFHLSIIAFPKWEAFKKLVKELNQLRREINAMFSNQDKIFRNPKEEKEPTWASRPIMKETPSNREIVLLPGPNGSVLRKIQETPSFKPKSNSKNVGVIRLKTI